MNRKRTTLLKGALLTAALIGSANQIPVSNIAEINEISSIERIAIGKIADAKSIILIKEDVVASNSIGIQKNIVRSIIG